MEYLIWLTANWQTILGIVGGVHATALAVVNLTPTPADNKAYRKVYRTVELAAGIFTMTAKTLPGEKVVKRKTAVGKMEKIITSALPI